MKERKMPEADSDIERESPADDQSTDTTEQDVAEEEKEEEEKMDEPQRAARQALAAQGNAEAVQFQNIVDEQQIDLLNFPEGGLDTPPPEEFEAPPAPPPSPAGGAPNLAGLEQWIDID